LDKKIAVNPPRLILLAIFPADSRTSISPSFAAQTACEGIGCGVVFKLAPDGTLTVLRTFAAGSDGAYLQSGLLEGPGGYLYGKTTAGGGTGCQIGAAKGCGTVFRIKE
jgi:hypothetical protein